MESSHSSSEASGQDDSTNAYSKRSDDLRHEMDNLEVVSARNVATLASTSYQGTCQSGG
jgi:hypothetical protein